MAVQWELITIKGGGVSCFVVHILDKEYGWLAGMYTTFHAIIGSDHGFKSESEDESNPFT